MSKTSRNVQTGEENKKGKHIPDTRQKKEKPILSGELEQDKKSSTKFGSTN